MSKDTHFAKYDLRDGFWRVPVSLELQKRLVMRHPGNARMIWCRSLPFGFIDSPRLFCSITEAVAQEFRRRVGQKQHSGEIPPGGIHMWCYVDDYLIAGDNKELTRIGCQIFEELMHELGFEWAPSKQRGPCRCIEFLGLLLVNMPGQQCIALTRKRQEYLTTLLHEWSGRRVKLAAEGADPKEMAHLLGHLVFASQVIPGGRVFMQSMLQQFQGLEVNWRLGLVRQVGDGQWAKVHVSEGFWDDLDWWTDHLDARNSTSLAYSEAGEAAVTGTDASDWGSGQAVYIDGGVEEARLEFTSAERRRPINWRELSGIIRIFEWYGSRLTGLTVLVETDNMSAKGAASKMASSSEDMAELIRRLLELAERHDIRVKLMHTPGEKLHRPDQSSRGNPIEEPRARVKEREFRALEHRFGPFTEMVGCERRLAHAKPVENAQDSARVAGNASGGAETAQQEDERACNMWLHPSFATVGSALRLACTRMSKETTARGVVVVPDAPSAGWSSLLRHFSVIGRWPAGSAHLETCVAGKWSPVRSRRPSLVLTFPRAAGGMPRPVVMQRTSDGGCITVPLLVGSIVYSPGVSAGKPGCLYTVVEMHHQQGDTEGDDTYIKVAELVRDERKGIKGKERAYSMNFVRVSDEYGVRPQSLAAGKWKPWEVDANLLWVVDYLVKDWSSMKPKEVKPGDGVTRTTPNLLKEMWTKTYGFDYRQAEVDIARQRVRISRQSSKGTREIEAHSRAGFPHTEVVAQIDTLMPTARAPQQGAGERAPGKGAQGGRTTRSMTNRTLQTNARSAEPMEESEDHGEVTCDRHEESLVQALMQDNQQKNRDSESDRQTVEDTADLDDLADGQVERLRQQFEEAAISAKEATAIGVSSRLKAAAKGKETKTVVPEGTLESELNDKRATSKQPGNGAEQLDRPAAARRKMICRSPGVICEGCELAIQQNEEMAVFSCGVIHLQDACEQLAREKKLSTLASGNGKAREMVTLQSSKKEAQLAHRFSDARLSMVRKCLAGQCGITHEPRVMCLGDCGLGLHAMACAQVSQSRAKLGLLHCIECRMKAMSKSSQAEPGGLTQQKVACRNMLTELTTGAETAAKNLTEFERLQRLWLADMAVDDPRGGADIIEPAHGEESFIGLLTWLVTDAGRARSFVTLVRGFAIALAKMQLPVWPSKPRVKAVVKELTAQLGLDPEPCVLLSRAIISLALERTIPDRCKSSRYLLYRTYVQLTMELAGGLRVGETTGAGEGHGVLANHCVIATPEDPGEFDIREMVVLTLEDSKTQFGRVVAICGQTRGTLRFRAADYMRGFWKESGFSLIEEQREGMKVIRPDYYVLRVSLLGMNESMREYFKKQLKTSSDKRVEEWGSYSARKVTEREGNLNDGEEKKCVNIAGGRKAELAVCMQWLESIGLGKFGNIVPGPLLRATDGKRVTHMPLQPGSSYTHLAKAMEDAYFMSRARGQDDAELDLGNHDPEKPKIGHHWARRKADQVARDTMDVTKTLPETIDEAFGWDQKQAKRKQQLHYAGSTALLKLCRVTMML